MKAGLIGFGRTGKAVAHALLESSDVSLEWVLRGSSNPEQQRVSDYFNAEEVTDPGLLFGCDETCVAELLDKHKVDVIIDFSCCEGMDLYGEAAAQRGIAIVSAISNYPDSRVEQLRELGKRTRVLWSPNITLGVNFLILAARLLRNMAPNADIEIIEEHFSSKAEVSGTARVLAKTLNRPVDSIKSIRAGGIVGRHEVLFGFPYQTVRLSHESIAREAFGNGAVFAAHNLLKRQNGFYSMQDLIEPYLYQHAG